ncbi:MAG: ATP-binding protein [Tepidiformaceae bacterium]
MSQELPEGTVTIVFTDAVGSTALTNRLGDERGRTLMREVDELVRAQIAHHRGVEVKGLGDGQMVAFTSARRAVLCAVDIQKALERWRRADAARTDLALRIGLHTGEVIREQEDLFGAAVNFAARVSSQAGAGEVLLSETTKSLLGAASEIALDDRGDAELKGFPGAWKLFAVVWQPDEEDAGPGTAGLVPYVGRDAERAILKEALTRARQGSGNIVLLAGEPGIGKTRLATELMADARAAGCFTVIGHCYEMEGTPPFVPFVEAIDYTARVIPPNQLREALAGDGPEVARIAPRLRQLFPDLPAAADVPADQGRHSLFTSFADYLQRACAVQPLVIVLDDLHWADDSSSLLLEHIAGRADEMALLVIGTYRDVDLDATRPFSQSLDRLGRRPNVRRLALRRFDRDGVRGLLRALSGKEPPAPLADLVANETEGVPLFVQELYRHLNEDGRLFDAAGGWRTDVAVGEVEVPEGVKLVIGRRLERVSEATRRMLTVASVAGRAFSFDLLAKVAELGDDSLLDALDEAERAHLLVPSSGREVTYTFSHEQIRQTLLGTLSLPRRQRAHLRVAQAMETVYARTVAEHTPELAYHFYMAGAVADPETALHWIEAAGDAAMKALASEEAEAHYRNALAVMEDGPPAVQARLFEKLGNALRASDWGEAEPHWRRAQELYASLGDAPGVGRTAFQLTNLKTRQILFDEARRELEHGLSVLDQLSPADQCRLLGIGGAINIFSGLIEPADVMLTRALAIAEALDDPQLLGETLDLAGITSAFFQRWTSVIESGSRATQLLRATGDHWNLCNASQNLGLALMASGRVRESLAPLEEGVLAGVRAGNAWGLAGCSTWQFTARFILDGDIEEYRRMEHWAADYPAFRFSAEFLSSYNSLLDGQWDAALAGARRRPFEGVSVWRGWEQGCSLIVEAYAGDADAVALLLEEHRDLIPSGGVGTFGGWTFAACATEALATVGRDDEAAAFLDLWEQATDAGQVVEVAFPVLVARLAGIAAASGRRWDVAVEHFETALRQAQEIPFIVEQPEVRRSYADMLIERGAPGDVEKARQLLAEAIGMYRTIGMPRHIELAERLGRRA